nr:MAG TPA: hypothetical protein [Caudoviricetes sp.]
MPDINIAYEQITRFLNSETEKTLLLCGIADEEKHRQLLKALNAQGKSNGLIFLIHATKDGMESFFHWAGLPKVKVPKKYGQAMRLSNLTIYFDNLSTKSCSDKYDNYAFDFMIVWPMQSVVKNQEEIEMLHKMAERQKTKKIIYLTIKEPWYSADPLKPIADKIIQLDCENDNPKEYKRIMSAYAEDCKRQERQNRFF